MVPDGNKRMPGSELSAGIVPLRVQVAFQGGGARLVSLLIAVEALQEVEKAKLIKVTRIAGTSSGAIAAALFAADADMEKVREMLLDMDKLQSIFPPKFIDFSNLETKSPSENDSSKLRRFGRFLALAYEYKNVWYSGEPLGYPVALETLINDMIRTSDRLENVPNLTFEAVIGERDSLRVVASDILHRREHSLQADGDSVPAKVVDSARLPFIFGNAPRNGETPRYFDGGLISNLPVDVLESGISDFGPIIAFSFEHQSHEYSRPQSPIELAAALIETTIDGAVSKMSETARPNVHIVRLPNIAQSTLDFSGALIGLKDDEKNNEYLSKVTSEIASLRLPLIREFHNYEISFRRYSTNYKIPLQDTNISFVAAKVDYPEHPVVRAAQETILAFVERETGVSPYIYSGTEGFDIALRDELAISVQAVYPFPFFLTWSRRGRWGVIPYGEHRAIGCIIHENNPLYSSLKGHVWSPGDVSTENHWFRHFIPDIVNKKQKIYISSGYLSNELFPEMFASKGLQSQARIFYSPDPKISEVMGNITDEKDEKSEFNPFPYAVLPQDVKKDRDIIAFVDLATAGKSMDAMSMEQLKLLRLPHGIPIPVGVGFTLAIGALFQNKELWHDMADIASEALHAAEEELLEAGIVLWSVNPEHRTNLNRNDR